MKGLIIFLCLVFWTFYCCNGEGNSPEANDWESFKSFHHKVFANSFQEKSHKEIFRQNAKEVEEHNKLYAEGKVSFAKELNQFADQDPSSFAKSHNGYRPINETTVDSFNEDIDVNADTPSSFDWRDEDKVSPIKSQGQCGSCWAFASVAAIESQVLIKGQSFQALSEEQLVDCDKRSKACKGGHQVSAFNYVIKAGGIMSEKSYPYTASRGRAGNCKFDKNKIVAKLSSMKRVRGSVDAMMQALVRYGPIAIGVNGSDLQHYSKGVHKCRSNNKDHAVLLIGYGSENGEDYWIIKNSYGKRWGQQGFAKISRAQGRDCGVIDDGAYPII